MYVPPARRTKWFDELVEEMPSMENKTVLITGTSDNSIGFEAAKALLGKGAKVIALNRDSESAKQGLGKLSGVIPVVCDLSEFDSVRKAAKKVKELTESIDVICNNAGIMALADKATVDGYDQQMQVNVLSHFLLVKELYPLLIKACEKNGQARVVNHSSIRRLGPELKGSYLEKFGGKLGGDGRKARYKRYQQSKLANCVFTYALKEKLKAIGEKRIKVYVAHPGLCSSQLQATTGKDGGMKSYRIMALSQSPADGACGIYRAMCDPELPDGSFVGPSFWIKFGAVKGPAVELKVEKKMSQSRSTKLFWQLATKACGEFSAFEIKL